MYLFNFTCILSVALFMSSSAFAQVIANDPFATDFEAVAKPQDSPAKYVAKPQVKLPPTSMLERYRKQNQGASAEEFIRFQLSQSTSQTFVEETLENAIKTISNCHEIPIVLDSRALQDGGLNADAPITIRMRDVKLRSLLHRMLEDLDLTYAIKDETLIVTTKEAAGKYATVQAHPLPEILAEKSEKVMRLLTDAVAPMQWDVAGGTCSIAMIDNVVVITAPETVHEQVAEFLEKLKAAFEASQQATR